ncbi:AAA family ATPase, partial [bacterium]|nr:AAA family ATPase [bacterium]
MNNNNNHFALLGDIPAGEFNRQDDLKFTGTAKILAQAAVYTENTITIGVLGEWGSGKTSLMHLIEQEVDKQDNAVAVWFNSWQYEKEEHLIVPLVATIKKQLENDINRKKWKGNLRKGAEKVRDALRAIAYGFTAKGKVGIPLVGEAEVNLSPKDMIERYQDLLDDTVLGRSLYYNAFERFEECTSQGKAPRIVVFVDDLDRCSPENALALLEHIKLVLNQKGFTFVLGVNEKAIHAAINQKSKETKDSSVDYLDKIIQVTVRVPKRQS